jgi:DnaJ-class molecular chaperone
MIGNDPRWIDEVRRWDAERNAPRLCGACGGTGERRGLLTRRVRECRACHGTGGAIDDERAWWRAGQR